MSERAPYSRVYWSIVDDPKFADVYDDDHHLATWLRLLLSADQAWPASANVPLAVRRLSFSKLVEAGLVDRQPGSRYRIHGLDKERGERRASATRARTGRDPVGTQAGPSWDPDDDRTPGRRRDETRQDETSSARPREGLSDTTDGVALVWSELSGKSILGSGQYAMDYLDDATRRHGEAKVVAAIRSARKGFPHIPATQPLAVAVRNLLDPLPNAKESKAAENEQREKDAGARRVAATLRKNHEVGGHEAEPRAGCPLCKA